MWPPFLSLKILGLGRQVNWLYRPACVGRLCHSKYKMAATSDILYKSTALIESSARAVVANQGTEVSSASIFKSWRRPFCISSRRLPLRG